MWGAVRGRHTGVQYGTVTGCSGCAGVLRGSGRGRQHATVQGARRGAALGRCPELCWGAAAVQGAQHVAAPRRSVGPSRALCQAVQGRGMERSLWLN